MTEKKHDIPEGPPSYEEAMNQDTEKAWGGQPLMFQQKPPPQEQVQQSLREYIHNPHPRSTKSFPGSQRLTYEYAQRK